MTITKQKPKTDWTDESGKTVPYSAIKKSEIVYEREAYNIAKAALAANKNLSKLKQFIQKSIACCVDAFHKDYKGKRTEFKGNYTIHNFNDTIKIEVSVSNPIVFDDLTIKKAQETFKEFLTEGVSAKDETIKEMVLGAFESTRGKLDVDKIMSLKRYSDRINDPRWKRAMQLIDQAIRRPATATYYRVWVKDENGKYQNIPLALANV
jgi:hypothetical protein